MNRVEVVAAMAEKTGLSKKEAEKVLKAFMNIVAERLKMDEKIQVAGFGTFKAFARKARVGINPQTGGEMVVKAARTPKFRAGKTLKDALNC
ncbi:MAG: HU family DNA-binding protein [Lachnospiraceae bacterium]|jgi:DNA-binding protein HU-beta|nr:HU family DNA-binding protein [Lachnospiraceae bacterium]